MSKRGAADYITKDGVGAMHGQEDAPVQRATAAQLANRKIAAARGRTGARRTANSGTMSPSPAGSFGASSQSFPPISAPTAFGNGSANNSFGGFGSGADAGSGFNFSSGTGVSNPFANAGQSSTNGVGAATNGGGFSFNFGGSQQPQASVPAPVFGGFGASQSSSTNQFGVSQQPSTSTPAPAFQFGAQPQTTPQQTTTSAFGVSQPQQSAAPAFSFGGQTAPSQPSSTSSLFNSQATPNKPAFAFGSAAQQSSTPMFNSTTPAPAQPASNLFAPPASTSHVPTSTAPSNIFGGFNAGATASTGISQSPPSAVNGDAMMESPEASPMKPQRTWNNTPKVTADDSKVEDSFEEQQPHIEQDNNRPNPFANISRLPPSAQTPASKPTFAKEQPSQATTQKSAEPSATSSLFSSIAANTPSASSAFTPKTSLFGTTAKETAAKSTAPPALEQASKLSFFPSNTSQTPKSSLFAPAGPPSETPKTSLFSSAPAPAAQASPAKAAPSLFKPQTTLSTDTVNGTNSQTSPAIVSKTATTSMTETISSAPSPGLSVFLPIILKEEGLSPPANIATDKRREWMQAQKLARLNKFAVSILSTLPAQDHSELFTDCLQAVKTIKGAGIATSATTVVPSSTANKFATFLSNGPKTGLTSSASDSSQPAANSLFKNNPSVPTPQVGGSSLFNAPSSSSTSSGSGTAPPSFSNSSGGMFGTLKTTSASVQNPGTLFSPFRPSSATETSNSDVQPSTNPFSGLKRSTEPAAAPATGFKFTPVTEPSDPLSAGFKFTPAASTATATGLPKFGAAASGGNNFLSQFGKSAEAAAAAAKKRAFDEDYDSDDGESKEEWEARYDREQEAKRQKMQETVASSASGGFKFTPTPSIAGSAAGSGDESDGRLGSRKAALPASGLGNLFAPSTNGSMSGSGDESESAEPKKSNLFAPKPNSFFKPAVNGTSATSGDESEPAATKGQLSLPGASTSSLFPPLPRAASPANAPSPGSVFDEPRSKTPSYSASNPFSKFASQPQSEAGSDKGDADDEEESDHEATPRASTANSQSGGLFGRITPRDAPAERTPLTATDGNSTAAKPTFSFTPAKSTGAPVFSGLFSGTQNNPGLTTPNLGTSAFGSRATTPGFSEVSGAESTANEAEEPKPDAQIDISDISQDKIGHEVIFESAKVKDSKHIAVEGEASGKWETAGVGPIAVLKDNDTGIAKVLMRTTPSGKIVLNTRTTAVLNVEQVKTAKAAKRARLIFMGSAKKPESHLIGFQTEDDCVAFVAACKANGVKG